MKLEKENGLENSLEIRPARRGIIRPAIWKPAFLSAVSSSDARALTSHFRLHSTPKGSFMEVTRSYRFPGFDDIDANGFSRGQRFKHGRIRRCDHWPAFPSGHGGIRGRDHRSAQPRPNRHEGVGEASHPGSNAREPCRLRSHCIPRAVQPQRASGLAWPMDDRRSWRRPCYGRRRDARSTSGSSPGRDGAAPSALCLISLPQAILRLNGMGQLHSHPALLPFPRRWAARVLEPSL